MHASMLADLAATLGFHSRQLIEQSKPVPAESLQVYWVASRKRAGHWHDVLSEYRQLESSGNVMAMQSWWSTNQAVLEEILVTEILTRVYAAIGFAMDSQSPSPEFSPVAQSVYVSHCEARNRVLGLMIQGRGIAYGVIARLNQLRISVERWTDVLVGQVAAVHRDSARYGTVLERTLGFAEESAGVEPNARQTQCWLMSSAMRASLERSTNAVTANAVENETVGGAVLHSFSDALFDSLGILESPWMHRLRSGTEETSHFRHRFSKANSAPWHSYVRKDAGHKIRKSHRPR